MDTKKKIIDIIVSKLGCDPAMVTEDAGFVTTLGADSLDIVELIMDIEREFEITIPDNMTEKIVTVGDAIKVVEEIKAK